MANIIIALFAIFIVTVSAVDLPDFLHVCSQNDPNLNECVTQSVMHLQPYLANGVPEYNIPALEPLLLKEVVASEGSGGIRITGKDIKAYGSSDFTVARMMLDPETLTFDFDINLPHLYLVGQYEIEGKVLLLPISGAGQMTCNVTGVFASVVFKTTSEPDSSGVRQFRITDFDLKVTITNGNLKLDNLFGGDGVIGDVVNNAINANFDIFIRELMPIIQRALASSFLEIGNGIVSVFTFDQLFPSN